MTEKANQLLCNQACARKIAVNKAAHFAQRDGCHAQADRRLRNAHHMTEGGGGLYSIKQQLTWIPSAKYKHLAFVPKLPHRQQFLQNEKLGLDTTLLFPTGSYLY